jgi:hypothetical protein
MRFSNWRKLAGLAALLVFVCVAALLILTPRDASGQQEPMAPVAPDQPQPPGAQAMRGMMIGRMMGGTPAIAVADGKVYVVLGGTLYKFNADTLALEAQNTFVERPPAGAAGFGGGGRGRRGGQGPAPAPAAPQ